LAIDPKYTDALTGKGNVLLYSGNYTRAIQYYDKALAIDPNNTAALNGKGFALAELGKYNEGLVFIDKALALDPNDAKYIRFQRICS
jgi:Flp pilus assembly protein TadD